MPTPADLPAMLLSAWETNNRANVNLIRELPGAVWPAPVPGVPRRTVRDIAAHIHNARCRWIKTLGREHGIRAPARVDQRRVTQRQLVRALDESRTGIAELLALGLERGGELPPSMGYVWRNLALDVAHVLTYFVGHEAHHRGQVVLVARQLGHRLSNTVAAQLWDWKVPTRRKRR